MRSDKAKSKKVEKIIVGLLFMILMVMVSMGEIKTAVEVLALSIIAIVLFFVGQNLRQRINK